LHRIRIDLVIESLACGGAEGVIVELANRFSMVGHDVRVVTTAGGGALVSGLSPHVRLLCLNASRIRHAVRPLAEAFRQDRATAILATQWHVNGAAALARRLAAGDARLVLREATMPDPASRWARVLPVQDFRRSLYRLADAVIAPTEGIATRLRELGVVHMDRLLVLPNPVDTDRIERMSKACCEVAESVQGPCIVALGMLRRVKRLDLLMRAFAGIADGIPHDLVIIGDGPERSSLERLAGALGLSERIRLTGHLVNPFPLVRRAALVALSSDREGLPNALLQALALDVPCVSTDCGSGPRDLAAIGAAIRLAPVGDVGRLGSQILATIKEPQTGTAALIRDRFGVVKAARRYLDVLIPGERSSESSDGSVPNPV
jgi:glycosyltransferase involved in cell wall biosynthesis